jgi:phytoene synthase
MLFQWFPARKGVPARDSFLANPDTAGLGRRAAMDAANDHHLPPEAELAIAWSAPKLRAPLTTALQLDRRLARIVARTTEPMLGQMRLAWWREALGKPVSERPRGDAVLDAIGVHWEGRESALVAMVDGWEVLVTAETIGIEEARVLGMGRGTFFAALDQRDDRAGQDRLAAAGYRWALADAAAAVSSSGERAVLVSVGLARAHIGGSFPRDLRGLAVLEALALRSLKRGGQPLMAGRGASLVALRAAIFLT